MIAGKSTRYGMVSIFTHRPMRGRLSSTRKRLPISIDTMRPQTRAGSSVMTFGPGVIPWMMKAPASRAMIEFEGRPRVSSGMNDVCAAALSGDALDRALPELLGVLRGALLDGVGHERGEHVPGSREHTQGGAEAGAAQHGRGDPAEVLLAEPQVLDLLHHDRPPRLALEIAEDLGDAEQADGQRDEVEALIELALP